MIGHTLGRLTVAGARAFWSLCGVFTGATACWIVSGVATPGDYFGNGSPWLWLALFACGAAGGYAAFKARSKRFRVALSVAALACAIFWLAAPEGWWAKPPPAHTREDVSSRRALGNERAARHRSRSNAADDRP
jgi:hypothetical protein